MIALVPAWETSEATAALFQLDYVHHVFRYPATLPDSLRCVTARGFVTAVDMKAMLEASRTALRPL